MAGRNDLFVQFLFESRLGSVIAYQSKALQHVKKLLFGRSKSSLAMQIQRLPDSRQLLVETTENLDLLFFRTVDEALSEYIPAAEINVVQTCQKTRSFVALIPLGQNEIDELIYPHGFRSGSISLINDELARPCNCLTR